MEDAEPETGTRPDRKAEDLETGIRRTADPRTGIRKAAVLTAPGARKTGEMTAREDSHPGEMTGQDSSRTVRAEDRTVRKAENSGIGIRKAAVLIRKEEA